MASLEYLSLFNKGASRSIGQYISFILSLTMMILAYLYPSRILPVLLPLSVLVNLILLYDLFYREDSIQARSPIAFNILYVALPISVVLSYRFSEVFSFIIICIVLMIWISDISAYFVGKTTGKRKLFPRISPGKTWEGFWGAGLITVLFSYVFFSYFNHFGVRSWALIAITIWLSGSMGDLVESKIKRHLNVKDSGTIMPGHGGFLDRFDAFIFCLPFVIALIHYLKL